MFLVPFGQTYTTKQNNVFGSIVVNQCSLHEQAVTAQFSDSDAYVIEIRLIITAIKKWSHL